MTVNSNIFSGRKMLCGGKCYKMIEKNRGNEVILEMVEALKNKNFEFPRADLLLKRWKMKNTVFC
jgi:hypothetical protein